MSLTLNNRFCLRALRIRICPGQYHSVQEKHLSSENYSAVSNVEPDLLLYAKKRQTSMSLKTLLDTGKGKHLSEFERMIPSLSNVNATDHERVLIQVASFLHRELPVRLAHRACELESTPVLAKSSHVQQVCNWYKQSFQEVKNCPAPTTLENERLFARTIESVYERHSATLINMAKGAHEIRTILNKDVKAFAEYDEVQKNLNDFYMSRIGIRLLIGQYLALKNRSLDPDMIGLVSQNASPFDIAEQAIRDASYICTRTHGDAPNVTIHGRTDLTFPYVPSHISYILIELLKNSMRATVEYHGIDKMPPIKVVIADGEKNEDVIIKVSDEGGGIPRSNMKRIWSYLFTTADPKVLESFVSSKEDVRDFDTQTPLAGLGYGLPISRNYARYFGGDLAIMSMEGYGTDSFVYLSRLTDRILQ